MTLSYPARQEYPRPQLVRQLWQNLNGKWNFATDPLNEGLDKKWHEAPNFSGTIQVPFAQQAEYSQATDKTPSDYLWYNRKFTLQPNMAGKEIILHFGAVDYQAWVYVNGRMVGSHEGGHTAFNFNITPYLIDGEQSITLRVFDPLKDETIPRGKQTWLDKAHAIWYTPTSGIWQTVWLEAVEKTHIKKLRLTPDVDRGTIRIEAEIAGCTKGLSLDIGISYKGEEVLQNSIQTSRSYISVEFELYNKKIFDTSFHHAGICWTPENPNLFDISLKLTAPGGTDEVASYFGLRKIHTENGRVYLNNRPYYQKLVLDQGYWPGGLLTAPKDEDFATDIRLAKEMGFNGARKHQKVEDPRFMYHADTMGFLVWGECGACPSFTPDSVTRLTREWLEIIERDYNHPSIVTWVPFNESWGIPNVMRSQQEQHHTLGLYYTIKSLDTTRLVVSNDGWEQTITDICAIHNYGHGQKHETARYNAYKDGLTTMDGMLKAQSGYRDAYANGYSHRGEPVLLTEFGGIAYKKDGSEGWGYTTVQTEEEFLDDYRRIIEAVAASSIIAGLCYTQITDVEQEVNGLLTYDRQPKVDTAKIREINRLV